MISIQSIGGHTLFACTVGDSDATSVSMDAWLAIEGMIKVVKRTGHSSYYVERGMMAIGKTQKGGWSFQTRGFCNCLSPAAEMGIPFPEYRINGGAFPIWLQNAPVCPIAVAAVYGGAVCC